MKKKFLLLLLVLIASSCSFFVRPKVKFEIENKTSKNLNLKVFSKSKLLNDISIKALSKYDTTVTYGDPGDNGQQTPFNYEIVDSIIVNFDNLKQIKYYCNGEVLSSISINSDCFKVKKNPLNFDYIGNNNWKSTSTKLLIFDENDFSMAEPL